MTVIVHIGRRVPNSWFKRTAQRVKGLMTFQENIWQIIKQSLSTAKRKAEVDGRLKFIMTYDDEKEDMYYKIQWIKIVIQGNEEMEKEEYEESLKLYDSLGKMFKKDYPEDNKLSKHFNSKLLSKDKIKQAYEKGYGSVKNNNISNKLLEMGILTHVEWIKDFNTRDEIFI